MNNYLTQKQQTMLSVLRSAGDWFSRVAIARGIQQKRLYPFDVTLLERLETQGLIEAQRVERPGAIPYEWHYRAK